MKLGNKKILLMKKKIKMKTKIKSQKLQTSILRHKPNLRSEVSSGQSDLGVIVREDNGVSLS